MKKYFKIILIIVIIGAIFAIWGMANKIANLNEDIALYDNNFKALNIENNKNKEYAIAYKFDVQQLEYINDSIINELNHTRKQLKIKDNQIKQIQAIKTEIHTTDSIFIKDTIFKENFIKLDTLLGDDWYKVKLEFEYPNKIKLDAKYTSDLNVFAYTSKEIIGTPKKCAIGRWFQKKQKVIRVEVHDKNLHANIKENKFIIVE